MFGRHHVTAPVKARAHEPAHVTGDPPGAMVMAMIYAWGLAVQGTRFQCPRSVGADRCRAAPIAAAVHPPIVLSSLEIAEEMFLSRCALPGLCFQVNFERYQRGSRIVLSIPVDFGHALCLFPLQWSRPIRL